MKREMKRKFERETVGTSGLFREYFVAMPSLNSSRDAPAHL
jgi:hypothetical protein